MLLKDRFYSFENIIDWNDNNISQQIKEAQTFKVDYPDILKLTNNNSSFKDLLRFYMKERDYLAKIEHGNPPFNDSRLPFYNIIIDNGRHGLMLSDISTKSEKCISINFIRDNIKDNRYLPFPTVLMTHDKKLDSDWGLHIIEPTGSMSADFLELKNNNDSIFASSIFLLSISLSTIVRRFMAFLSCKNIQYVEAKPNEKQQKARMKHNRFPLSSYYELVIKQGSETHKLHEKKGNNAETRVHLMRGHFKKYTTEQPLFGNITGVFWWAPAVRGNQDKGKVNKYYRLGTKQ